MRLMNMGRTRSQDGPGQKDLRHNVVGPETRKNEQRTPMTEMVPKFNAVMGVQWTDRGGKKRM